MTVLEILSGITAWSPMVGTPIDQVRRLINQGLIKDLIPLHKQSSMNMFHSRFCYVYEVV